ncbi:S1C family serine protease [Blautia sp.]|uniref:S1C family serine protease n=1 Tax=Blautia sp. TaxID=1955243 RepID=UPI002580A307|nr:trypsin-like peptidase domain-containing protein [Blautia sp.]
MSDEWKVPGTEPEENQQTVVEETETAEVTDGKENEEAAAEETAVTTESTEQDVTPEQAEVTETAEEVRPDADAQAGETGEVKTRYPWEAVLGKEERKEADQEQVEQSAPETPVQPQEQAAPQSDAQTTDPQAAGSYHWVNPEYQKRQNGTDGEERTSQNTYENQNYREDVSGTADTQNRTETTANEPNNGGWGQPVGGNHTTKETENSCPSGQTTGGYQNGNWGCAGNGQNSQNTQNGGAYQNGNSWTSREQSTQNGPVTGQRKYGNYTYYQPQQDPNQPQDHRKPGGTGKKVLVTLGLAVLFGVVAGGIIIGSSMIVHKEIKNEQKTEYQLPTTELPEQENADGDSNSAAGSGSDATEEVSAGTTGEYTVAQVAKSCMPSVVSITNASVKTVQDFFGGVQQYPSESSGSGIIVGQNDSEILVATNNHVVADADTITVAFDDDAVYEAQVKGTDSDNDLAVVAVKISDMSEDTLKSIKVVSIGNSDELEIGEQVVAIGNALGYGQSVTSGWISAVDREVTDEDGKTTGKLIQTDAAINPGNSGGALLNMQGELIGINSAKAAATEVEGMGYAIPVSVAQPILDELMNRETRYKTDEEHAGYIGVTCLNVDSTSAQTYGIPLGAFVDSVEEGGPAQTAGIQKGDVIVKFDGMTVSGSSDLVGKLEYYQAGETVDVVISRAQNGEYQEQTVSVTLGKKSEMKQADPQQGK